MPLELVPRADRDFDADRGKLAELVARALSLLAPGSSPPEAELVRALAHWAARVLAWNERIDLTAARSREELIDLLVADAAVIAANASSPEQTWVDVGSGAGAPGLALALLRPELAITLVEPKAKRVAFLRTVVGELGLSRVEVVRARAEALPRAAYDVAISRATLPPVEWLAEGVRLARERVWVLTAREEPPDLTGWKADTRLDYIWPLCGGWRRASSYHRVLG